MKPALVPFRAEHLMMISNRDGLPQDAFAMAQDKQNRGPAWAAVLDDRVIGCGGFIVQWPGVAAVWMCLTEEVGRHGIWLYKTTRRLLVDLMDAYGLHRIECAILKDNVRDVAWIERLGFEFEGEARRYTSDKRDCLKYAYIREVR